MMMMMMFSVVVVVVGGDVEGEKSIPEAKRASHTLYQRSASRIAVSGISTSKMRSPGRPSKHSASSTSFQPGSWQPVACATQP